MILVQAYVDLASCRSMGFGIGPIPWTAIMEWCDRFQLTRTVREFVNRVVRAVDNETLRREAVKMKARTKGGSG